MNDMEFIEKYLGNTKDDGLARYRRNGENTVKKKDFRK